MKAQRLVLLSQLHGVTVTGADFEGLDGLTLPGPLFEVAAFSPSEKVDVYCLESGSRLSCEVRSGGARATVTASGATAHLLKPGARVVVSAWGWVKGKQALKHQPRVVHVDADNAPS